MAGGACHQERRGRAVADRVAHRRRDRRSGDRRHDARVDRLAGLRRIGIDEITHKRGHRYLTVVVDHDTGRLVWAAPGRDHATVDPFFESSGRTLRRARACDCGHGAVDRSVVAERHPRRSAALIRSMSSPGPPKPSTSNGVERGTAPRVGTARREPGTTAPSVLPGRSNRPATPCGRTPAPDRPPTPPARLDRQIRSPPVAGLPAQRRHALCLELPRFGGRVGYAAMPSWRRYQLVSVSIGVAVVEARVQPAGVEPAFDPADHGPAGLGPGRPPLAVGELALEASRRSSRRRRCPSTPRWRPSTGDAEPLAELAELGRGVLAAPVGVEDHPVDVRRRGWPPPSAGRRRRGWCACARRATSRSPAGRTGRSRWPGTASPPRCAGR